MENIIKNTDWERFKKQKMIFINMIQSWGESDDIDQQKDAEEVEGLLNWIDIIQDSIED